MQDTLIADSPDGRQPTAARQGLVWETVALIVALLATFLLAALIFHGHESDLTGPVGNAVAAGLNWLLGRWIAFCVPVAFYWLAVQLFLGRSTAWNLTRAAGIVLLLVSATGFVALPSADTPSLREEMFLRAGAVGSFLVEWEGLRLVGTFGVLGAGLALTALSLVSLVMITHLRISHLAMMLLGREADEPSEDGNARRVADVPATIDPRREALAPHFTDEHDDDFATQGRPASASQERVGLGMFPRFFGRREAALADPDPLESQEIPLLEFPPSFDEDAIAAARALEEARIDEEYEKALRAESAPANTPERPLGQSEIIFHESGTAELPRLKGNPLDLPAVPAPVVANPSSSAGQRKSMIAEEAEGGEASEPASAAALVEGLAKLFPTRYEATAPKPAPYRAKSAAEVRDEDESRLLRQTAARTTPAEVPPPFDLDESASDPLFNPDLETRPSGVAGALKAQSVSAVEAQELDDRTRRIRALSAYRLPDLALLEDPPKVDNRMSREEMMEISATLEKTFADFNIEAKVMEVKQGPVVTRFEMRPAPGVKVSRIVSLEHDLALAMRAESVRIVAPIPGKAAVGIEIPNRQRAGVYFKELANCTEFWDHPSPLAFALGKTIEGQPYFADLKKMPHLLIAGATGAGKSVCLNTVICSLLYRMRPDRLRLLMVDPKRVELSIYQDIPHLISPVVCDAKRAAAALNWAVEQMEDRYKKLVEFNVRNIDGYNEIVSNPEKQAKHRGKNMDHMPHMVIIVDELADLMVVAKAEVEESIQRLAQMSRAVGIHLILATQRPSVNVITGIIKANFPTRIAFQVSQKVDSRTILDGNGAEALLGRGDMLFAPAGAGKPIRVQGCFLSDEEVERIANTCRNQSPPLYEVEEFEPLLSEKEQKELARLMGAPTSMDDLDMQDAFTGAASRGTNKTMGKVTAGMFVPHGGGSANAGDEEIDEALVRAAARTILEARKGSTSLVQRRLKVGFARAGRLMDMLEEMGIVGAYKGSKPRDLLVDCDAALAQLDVLEAKAATSGKPTHQLAAELDGEDDLDEEFDEEDNRR
jgi:S-DNA-T family DNA segregation ATPase FtsK/SpoIIIE